MAEYTEISLDELIANPASLDPVTYQYYKNLCERRIILDGQVDDSILETVILPLREMDNDGTGKPIEIVLSTPGGSVFDAMCLCDVIDKLKTPTTITCFGYAFSMGSLLLMSGYNNPNVKKKCYQYSTALIHAGSSYLEGNTNAVKDYFHFYEKFEDKIRDYTLSHTKITEDEYKAMERCEWYMTSDDMLAKGLVDEII